MKILSLIFLTTSCFGQVYYSVSKTTTLNSAAEAVTVQQPSSGNKAVRFQGVYFKCSVSCTIYLENAGTTATTTTLAVNPINAGERAAAVTAFSSSNVGVGTVLKTFNLDSTEWKYLDLTGYRFFKPHTVSAPQNLTIRTSTITGTVDIIFNLTENDQ